MGFRAGKYRSKYWLARLAKPKQQADRIRTRSSAKFERKRPTSLKFTFSADSICHRAHRKQAGVAALLYNGDP